LTRKAIGLATVTLHVKQYADSDKIVHIDIDQTATGGIKGTSERRKVNWEYLEHADHIFGELKGRSRWVTIDLVDDDFLKLEWLDGEGEKGGPAGEHIMESWVEAKAGWTGRQIWGFAMVNGERRYTRRVVIAKGDEVLKIRMVYNWYGPEA